MTDIMRPLNIVQNIIDKLDLSLTYVYDDLVFIEQAVILIQFDKKNQKTLMLFLHKDMSTNIQDQMIDRFSEAAKQYEVTVNYNGRFELLENAENHEVDIVFH